MGCAVVGLNGELVTIEIDVSAGFPVFIMVGLTDKSIDESRQRLPAAIKNSGFEYPGGRRIVVNLAPADLKKEGSAYDLPIALGILSASDQMPTLPVNALFIGELALDGSLRPTRGVLPMVIWAREQGIAEVYVPMANAAEASIISNIKILAVKSLRELVGHLREEEIIQPYSRGSEEQVLDEPSLVDMAHISGQEHSKRALEVAAAGGHNLLMSGPPGSGKTLLSRALPTILPAMSVAEQLEVTKIYSIAGRLTAKAPLVRIRPFRSPHHTTSGEAWTTAR